MECVGTVTVTGVTTRGLSNKFTLTCSLCEVVEIWDSDEGRLTFPDASVRPPTTSAISARMVFAMISAGLGMSACNTILNTLNIKVSVLYKFNVLIVSLMYSQPFWGKTYNAISLHFENVIESVCARVMDANLKQEMCLSGIQKLGIINCSLGALQNISASYDMTWTKRGYHSPQVRCLNTYSFRSLNISYEFLRVLACSLDYLPTASLALASRRRYARSATPIDAKG